MNPFAARALMLGAYGLPPAYAPYELGGEADYLDDELDMIEGEVDDLGLDDYDDDDMMVLGAAGSYTAGRIARLEARLARLEDKLSTSTRPRQQRRLRRRIERVKRKLAKARGRLERKLDRAVKRGKLHPATAAGIAAGAGVGVGAAAMTMARPTLPGTPGPGINAPAQGGAMTGYSMLDYPATPFSGRVPPTQLMAEVERSPSAGEEVRLPLLVADSPVVNVNIPPGAGLRTVAIVAQSRLIPYAAFQVTGLDVIVNSQPNADALVNLLVSQYGVAGDKNLLYDVQNVGFAGQTRGGVDGTTRRTIAGLRENQVLQPTNTIQASAVLRQEITNAADINLTVELSMVGRVIYDPAVRR